MKAKLIRLIAAVAALVIVPAAAALAATPVAGTESYRYIATLSTGSNSMSDTASLKFDNVTAEFNYDISAVPVGTNVGVFWPKRGILRKPGVAVVEFLPRIEPGLPVPAFMAKLEAEVEASSNRLLAEAGFRT